MARPKNPETVAKTPKTTEEKAADFFKVIPGKVDRILKAVSSLKASAKPGRYAWTAAQRDKVFRAIADAVTDAEAAFRDPKTAKVKPGFSL